MGDAPPAHSSRRAPHTVELDLRTLPSATELHRAVAEALALAGSVVLHRCHGQKDEHEATIQGEDNRHVAVLTCTDVDERALASFNDAQEATEQGAVGVAIMTARRVLNRVVFRRLPTRTGADYLMRHPEGIRSDEYERLECSGIGEGAETAMTRLRRKVDQLARYSDLQPGYAIVTRFPGEPVEILYERWSR